MQSASRTAALVELLSGPSVSAAHFADWVVTHPLPRLLLRCLGFPCGLVGSLEGLSEAVPPPLAQSSAQCGTAAAGSGDAHCVRATQDATLCKLVSMTRLSLPQMRACLLPQLRAAAASNDVDGCVSLAQFTSVVGDALLMLAEAELMKAARRLDTLNNVPSFLQMKIAARTRLLRAAFECCAGRDGTLSVARWVTSLTRTLAAPAVDKLAAVYAAYDGRAGTGSALSAGELSQLVLGLMAAAGETGHPGDGRPMDALELEQADWEFACEFADSINVEQAASIPFDAFVDRLRSEPALFECLAVALLVPVDGLSAGEPRDDDGAATSAAAPPSGGGGAIGATFDFGLLRTIRDRYSNDVTKDRGDTARPSSGSGRPATGSRGRGARSDGAVGTTALTLLSGPSAASSDHYTILARAVDRHNFR